MAVSRTVFAWLALALLWAPGAAAKPVATLLLDATPDALVVEPDQEGAIEVHVTARLQCTQGFEKPADLRLVTLNQTPSTVGKAGYLVPETDHLAWGADGATSALYVIDAVVTLEVVGVATPDAVQTQNVSVGVAPDEYGAQSGRCGLDGYRIDAAMVTVPLTFVPADAATENAEGRGPGGDDVNWPAILIAAAILAAVAVFAVMRERARRR